MVNTKKINNINFNKAVVSIDSWLYGDIYIHNINCTQTVYFIRIWYEGSWNGLSWVSQFLSPTNDEINCYWLNGSWILGGILKRINGSNLIVSKISPKSFFRPKSTLSLNYANYK